MIRTAVAAPAQEPTDNCNWLPLRAMRHTNPTDDLCGRPCVQEFTMTVANIDVVMHRCKVHRISEKKLGLIWA